MTTRLTERGNLQTTSSGSRPTCKQLRHHRQIGPNPVEDEQLNSQHSSSPDDWWFSQSLDRFELPGEKPPANRRGVWTVHPQIQHVQSCTAWSHVIIRTLVDQSCKSSGLHTFVSPTQLSSTCHVSFLAAPDTDHKHKFSPTHFIHFSCLSTVSPLQSSPMILDPYTPCDVPRQSGGSAQIPSLAGSEGFGKFVGCLAVGCGECACWCFSLAGGPLPSKGLVEGAV